MRGVSILFLFIILLTPVMAQIPGPSEESRELFREMSGQREEPNITAEVDGAEATLDIQVVGMVLLLVVILVGIRFLLDHLERRDPDFKKQVSKAAYYIKIHESKHKKSELKDALKERGYSSQAISEAMKRFE